MHGRLQYARTCRGKSHLSHWRGVRDWASHSPDVCTGRGKLVIADMNEDGGQQTVHLITENGGEATFVQVDVTSTSAVEAMISKTVETYGRLDCAHNNAGIAGRIRAPLHECPEDVWDQVLAINLKGVWLCMKYEILQMLQQENGTIVNTASIM